jgi:hypothetical protein
MRSNEGDTFAQKKTQSSNFLEPWKVLFWFIEKATRAYGNISMSKFWARMIKRGSNKARPSELQAYKGKGVKYIPKV